MAQYIGIDLGTSMIKAAAVGGAEDLPTLLHLEPPDFFLPVAVQFSSSGGNVQVGASAYRSRRLAHCNVAVDFRDQLITPGSSLLVGGQSVEGLQLQVALLGDLANRISAAATDQVAGVAVALPDHWNDPQWSLSVALARSEWNPNLLVREWIAVLAMQSDIAGEDVMFLSMGAGGVQATYCQKQGGLWRQVAQASTNAVSGTLLRRSLVNRMSEAVVQTVRKDPREDASADQVTHDSLERALRELLVEPSTTFTADVFGQRFSQALSRETIATWAEPLKAPFQKLIKGLLADSRVNVETCPIIAWGELSMLLPLSEWVAPFCSTRVPLRIAPLDVVAAGAARLSAMFDQNLLDPYSTLYGYVDMDHGQYFQEKPEEGRQRLFAILEGPPALTLGSSGRKTASLVLVTSPGEGTRRDIEHTRFLLGTRSNCEWAFEYDDFPTVSGNHAEIARDGSDFLLADLSSTNGTYLNGAQVRKKLLLRHGDEINLGRAGPCLRFEFHQEG